MINSSTSFFFFCGLFKVMKFDVVFILMNGKERIEDI